MLSNKIAIITGASSGIGVGIANRFVQEGANICLVGIDNAHYEKVTQLAFDFCKQGKEAIAVKANLLNMKDIDSIVNKTVEKFGRIDILINNAGVFFMRMLNETTEEVWDETFNVNVKGPYFLTKRAVPYMKECSKIVFTGSIFGSVGVPECSVYGASKMAVHGLTKNLAIELAGKKINVNAVAPGNIDTPINIDLYKKLGGREEVRKEYPLGRIGLIEDIAASVAFLSSNEADWITGVILPVDGGYLAK